MAKSDGPPGWVRPTVTVRRGQTGASQVSGMRLRDAVKPLAGWLRRRLYNELGGLEA